VLGEPTEEIAACVFIEKRIEELVRAIEDVDQQLLHFLSLNRRHGTAESSRMGWRPSRPNNRRSLMMGRSHTASSAAG